MVLKMETNRSRSWNCFSPLFHSRGTKSGQRAIWNVSGGRPEIPAHVDARQHPGDGGKKHAKHSEPRVAILVLRKHVLAEIPAQPAVNSVLRIVGHEAADEKVRSGQEQHHQQGKLQLHHPLDAGQVDDAQQEDGAHSKATNGPDVAGQRDEAFKY